MSKRVAVVTGAGSGIGRAIAMKLAAEYALINVDINGENLAAVEREIATQGFHAQSIVGDVADRATHIKARELAAVNGTLVAWVNCAGWTRGAALHDFPNDPKLFEELIAEVVAFLLSDKASYVSGQSLAVEGAWTSALGAIDLDPDLARSYGLNSETGLAE